MNLRWQPVFSFPCLFLLKKRFLDEVDRELSMEIPTSRPRGQALSSSEDDGGSDNEVNMDLSALPGLVGLVSVVCLRYVNKHFGI